MAKRPAHIPPVGPYAQCLCLRCGYDWESVKPARRPQCCPRCHSQSWDVAPTKEGDRKPGDPPNPKWNSRGECCGECGRPLTQKMLRARQAKEDALRAQFSIEAVAMPTEPVTLGKIAQSIEEAARRQDPRELPPGLTPPPMVPDMLITVPMPRELTPRRVRDPEPAVAELPQDTPERIASRQANTAAPGSLSAELQSELERNSD